MNEAKKLASVIEFNKLMAGFNQANSYIITVSLKWSNIISIPYNLKACLSGFNK